MAAFACSAPVRRWFLTHPTQRLVVVYLVVQMVLAYVSWGTSVRGGYWGGKRYNRDFQSQKAADQLQSQTQAAFPKGIPIVMGLSNIADVISLRLPNRPPVWVEGKLLYSPWLAPQAVCEQGALLVVQNLHEAPPILANAGLEPSICHWQALSEYGLWWCVIPPGAIAARP